MMKDIPGYEGLYAADENGTIYSRKNGPMKPYVNVGGYWRVNLFKDGSAKHEYVHRLVAKTFLPNPDNLPEINHINRDKSDNQVINLEWCTTKENAQAALSTGKYARSIAVIAISLTSGEVRKYHHLKTAGKELFGKWYALNYPKKRRGNNFVLGDWDIRCNPEGGDVR